MFISCDFAISLIYPTSTNLGVSSMHYTITTFCMFVYSFQSCSPYFQLTSSVSVPIAEFYPERRILIDWCFAVSYDLPNNLTSFYSIPIWPGFANYQTKREIPHNEPSFYAKYGYNALTQTHPKDFSAGELYAAMEDALGSYGFHDTCLLRSVCELARHPFDGEHLLSDIFTFVLR